MYQTMKFLILLFLIIYSKALILLRNHKKWSISNKKSASAKIPYLDYYWNYCDKKCLYLQNYLPINKKNDYQFAVVEFTETDEDESFAACYVF